jgi:hypothetical protein
MSARNGLKSPLKHLAPAGQVFALAEERPTPLRLPVSIPPVVGQQHFTTIFGAKKVSLFLRMAATLLLKVGKRVRRR